MKKCPYCAEEIQDEAIVCRYCGRDLNFINPPTQPRPVNNPVNPPIQPKPVRKKGVTQKWRLRFWAFVFFVLCICLPVITRLGNKNSNTQPPASNQLIETLTPTFIITTTSTKTPTHTPTITPTQTPTLTLEPATQTAIAVNQTATQKADNSTATKYAANVNATNTVSAAIARKTGTAQAKSELATQIAQYTKIDVRELVTYPDNHIGEFVVISGRVFNINSDTQFQIWIDGISYEAVYIVMLEPFKDIYENDRVTVYGMVFGKNCGTNAFGAEVCQPVIYGDMYEKK